MLFHFLRRDKIFASVRFQKTLRGEYYINKATRMSEIVYKVRDALAESTVDGKFRRVASGFREIISADHPTFKPEANRYHLYISLACPWANRCLVLLKLKGLDHVIGYTVAHPVWQKTKPDDASDEHHGWAFYDSSSGVPLKNPKGFGAFVAHGCTLDPNNDPSEVRFIRDLYEKSNDKIRKFSVPVLWDKKLNTIVNNESSEIVRMFNSAFQEFATGKYKDHDFYPEDLRSAIDDANTWIYENINDGVYKCGFAKSQAAYDEAIVNLYNALDRVEEILAKQRYIVSNTVVTEADIRLFMTLVRFDEVYVVYFKCNVKRMIDYPNIRQYMRDLYQLPEMKHCVDMDHIKNHYFGSHPTLNAYAIVPKGFGTVQELQEPHDREKFSS